MALESLTDKRGPLAKPFSKLDPNTIQHASEITNDRRDNNRVCRLWFWTADSALYRVEDDEIVLYFGQRDTNLLFRHIDEAIEQLLKNKNYVPTKENIQSVINSVQTGNTLKIKLSDLELERCDDESCYFEINTSNYDSLKQIQKIFAKKIYGQGDDFEKNMERFNDVGIATTTVYVLNPEYVKEYVKKDSAIVRASWLLNYDVDSIFSACNNDVNNADGWLRGVPLVTRSDAQKIREVLKALKNPAAQQIAANVLTSETVQGYSNVLQLYSSKAQ